MKKSICVMTVIFLFTGISLISAEMKSGMMEKGDKKGMMGMMSGDGMMDKGMMGGKMMMCQMMMQSMVSKSIVSAGDGGVMLLSGNKLTKYDKDLNLVKEVEIKADMEGMQKMMPQMMENCPMMGKGMMGGTEENKQADKSQEATGAPVGEVDHKSHH